MCLQCVHYEDRKERMLAQSDPGSLYCSYIANGNRQLKQSAII